MFKSTMSALLADAKYKPTLQDIAISVGLVCIMVLTAIVECL